MDHPIQVVCYAGGLADERPEAIVVDGERHGVAGVVARWIEEGPERGTGCLRCFSVLLSDGFAVSIYRDDALGMWFLRCAERRLILPEGG